MWLLLVMLADPSAASGFDLARVAHASSACEAANAGEIVVCGNQHVGQRVVLPDPAEPLLPRAEVNLGGGASANLHVDQRMLGGAASNRLMVGVKAPF